MAAQPPMDRFIVLSLLEDLQFPPPPEDPLCPGTKQMATYDQLFLSSPTGSGVVTSSTDAFSDPSKLGAMAEAANANLLTAGEQADGMEESLERQLARVRAIGHLPALARKMGPRWCVAELVSYLLRCCEEDTVALTFAVAKVLPSLLGLSTVTVQKPPTIMLPDAQHTTAANEESSNKGPTTNHTFSSQSQGALERALLVTSETIAATAVNTIYHAELPLAAAMATPTAGTPTTSAPSPTTSSSPSQHVITPDILIPVLIALSSVKSALVREYTADVVIPTMCFGVPFYVHYPIFGGSGEGSSQFLDGILSPSNMATEAVIGIDQEELVTILKYFGSTKGPVDKELILKQLTEEAAPSVVPDPFQQVMRRGQLRDLIKGALVRQERIFRPYSHRAEGSEKASEPLIVSIVNALITAPSGQTCQSIFDTARSAEGATPWPYHLATAIRLVAGLVRVLSAGGIDHFGEASRLVAILSSKVGAGNTSSSLLPYRSASSVYSEAEERLAIAAYLQDTIPSPLSTIHKCVQMVHSTVFVLRGDGTKGDSTVTSGLVSRADSGVEYKPTANGQSPSDGAPPTASDPIYLDNIFVQSSTSSGDGTPPYPHAMAKYKLRYPLHLVGIEAALGALIPAFTFREHSKLIDKTLAGAASGLSVGYCHLPRLAKLFADDQDIVALSAVNTTDVDSSFFTMLEAFWLGSSDVCGIVFDLMAMPVPTAALAASEGMHHGYGTGLGSVSRAPSAAPHHGPGAPSLQATKYTDSNAREDGEREPRTMFSVVAALRTSHFAFGQLSQGSAGNTTAAGTPYSIPTASNSPHSINASGPHSKAILERKALLCSRSLAGNYYTVAALAMRAFVLVARRMGIFTRISFLALGAAQAMQALSSNPSIKASLLPLLAFKSSTKQLVAALLASQIIIGAVGSYLSWRGRYAAALWLPTVLAAGQEMAELVALIASHVLPVAVKASITQQPQPVLRELLQRWRQPRSKSFGLWITLSQEDYSRLESIFNSFLWPLVYANQRAAMSTLQQLARDPEGEVRAVVIERLLSSSDGCASMASSLLCATAVASPMAEMGLAVKEAETERVAHDSHLYKAGSAPAANSPSLLPSPSAVLWSQSIMLEILAAIQITVGNKNSNDDPAPTLPGSATEHTRAVIPTGLTSLLSEYWSSGLSSATRFNYDTFDLAKGDNSATIDDIKFIQYRLVEGGKAQRAALEQSYQHLRQQCADIMSSLAQDKEAIVQIGIVDAMMRLLSSSPSGISDQPPPVGRSEMEEFVVSMCAKLSKNEVWRVREAFTNTLAKTVVAFALPAILVGPHKVPTMAEITANEKVFAEVLGLTLPSSISNSNKSSISANYEFAVSSLLPLLGAMVFDRTKAVRDAATSATAAIASTLRTAALLYDRSQPASSSSSPYVNRFINDTLFAKAIEGSVAANQGNYLMRVQMLTVATSIGIDKTTILIPTLVRLAGDEIINVRLGVARAIGSLMTKQRDHEGLDVGSRPAAIPVTAAAIQSSVRRSLLPINQNSTLVQKRFGGDDKPLPSLAQAQPSPFDASGCYYYHFTRAEIEEVLCARILRVLLGDASADVRDMAGTAFGLCY